MIRAKSTLVYPILFLFTWHFRSVDGRSKDVWAEAVHSMHWVKKIYLSLRLMCRVISPLELLLLNYFCTPDPHLNECVLRNWCVSMMLLCTLVIYLPVQSMWVQSCSSPRRYWTWLQSWAVTVNKINRHANRQCDQLH